MLKYCMADIRGFNNYIIFDDGSVMSVKSGKLLKRILHHSGYEYYLLRKNNKTYFKSLHRLLADAYIQNPENKPEIDHIDRNKANNSLLNLCWATHAENQANKGAGKNNKLGIKNIHKYDLAFIFTKTINKKRHTKRFETLDEAIEYATQYYLLNC